MALRPYGYPRTFYLIGNHEYNNCKVQHWMCLKEGQISMKSNYQLPTTGPFLDPVVPKDKEPISLLLK